jgi:hypothetical protein
MHIKFSSETTKEIYYLGHQRVDGRTILKKVLNKYGVLIRTGFIWLKILFSGGLMEENTVMNLQIHEEAGIY